MKILKKLLGVPNALIRAIAEKTIVGFLRDGFAGQHGPAVQRVLEALKGKKLFIGGTLGGLAFLAAGLEYDQVAFWLGWTGGPLAAVGLVDKAIHEPGRPDFLAENALYRLLADNAGTIAAALLSAFAYVSGADCITRFLGSVAISCAAMGQALMALSLALVYLGILDAGFLSKTPAAVKAGK
jgi:hypothetical protein